MVDFDYIRYRVKHVWDKFRQWCAFSTNKYYFRFLKAAFFTVPFDYADLLVVQKTQLEFMLNYMEKRLWTTDDVYDEIIRWIKLALSLNDIITNSRDIFHFDGDFEFKKLDGKFTQLITDNIIYKCDVYVNTKNINRYVYNKEKQEAYLNRVHELYRLKAKTLYFKIFAEHIERWWD